MKKILIYISFFMFLSGCDSWQTNNFRKTLDKDPELKKHYKLGLRVGQEIAKTLKEKERQAFMLGIQDGLKSNKEQTKTSAKKEKQTKPKKPQTTKKDQTTMQKNTNNDKKFLEDHKKQEGVKVTASGLQYKVLKEGTGKKPKASDTVEVHYRGTLIDGTEFDSSYKRNKSISFPLNGVIAGWTEGLQLMKEGAKYKLVIPSHLGYGETGAGQLIYPNATLIFEVELIKVL